MGSKAKAILLVEKLMEILRIVPARSHIDVHTTPLFKNYMPAGIGNIQASLQLQHKSVLR